MPGVKATGRFTRSSKISAVLDERKRVELWCARDTRRMAGFTLVDLLVSISVIAVLIGILLPSLSSVRETTRRVVCSSNVRQHGLGLAMYTEDYGSLPPSDFQLQHGKPVRSATPADQVQTQNSMIVRIMDSDEPRWDGLGFLFQGAYLDQPGVFYCPSHTGEHPYKKYSADWVNGDRGEAVIFINYQYRGAAAVGSASTSSERIALLSDGLRTQADYNHKIGNNVLRSDFGVAWYSDPGGSLRKSLPETEADVTSATRVDSAWQVLDERR